MIDYKLYKTIEILELTVDNLSKEVHTLRQQQQDMIEQIRRLKEMNNDGSGK
jgi:chaperonin cofactor prefoldin